jgi:hypothetical protein
MTAAGIAASDFTYVDFIVSKESGWRAGAVNPNGGACGLLQQLPCGKWAHQWDDPVGALIDGNSYALSRYGSWAAAYAFWTANHWW